LENQQLDDINNSLREIIDNPFIGHERAIYSVVDALFFATFIINRLPANNESITLFRTYYTEAERKGFISTHHIQFLTDFIFLANHVNKFKETRGISQTLLDDMREILKHYKLASKTLGPHSH
jgi:hypothetical protein